MHEERGGYELRLRARKGIHGKGYGAGFGRSTDMVNKIRLKYCRVSSTASRYHHHRRLRCVIA